ncbi:MAG: hypothetical protein KatS3mg105_3985 [Gemmatales bacterium]|nr:MAG: hypothetical protein KatS3mg105_3985 [Gemmatales bacterium]
MSAKERIDIVDEALEESFPASDPPGWTPVTGARAAAVTPHPLAMETRTDYDTLLKAMEKLQAALSAAASGREAQWAKRVEKELRAVHDLLRAHVQQAERTDGLLATIDLTRPTLMRRVEALKAAHQEMTKEAAELLQEIGKDRQQDVAYLRQRIAGLLQKIHHHHADEADIIFETFQTDIGAGD